MRILFLILGLAINSLLWSQNTLKDTISIPEVEIQTDFVPHFELEIMDSLALKNPVNKDLGEALSRNSHAFVKSYGMGSMASVSLRGAASDHTNLVWNGINLNSSTNGIVDFSLYPNLFVDQLSLSYGANSLLYGSGGIGGAVSMENQVIFKKQQSLSVEQQVGSFDFRSTQLKYKLGNSKIQSETKFFYRRADNDFAYNDIGVEGFPEKSVDHGDLLQRSFMQSLYFRPSNSWKLESHYWYYFSDRNLPNMMMLRDLEEKQRDESHRISIGSTKYYKYLKIKTQLAFLQDDLLYENNGLEEVVESRNNSLRSFLDGEYELNKWQFKARLNADYEEAIHPSLEQTVDRKRISFYTQTKFTFRDNLNAQFSFRQEYILEEDEFFLPNISLNYKPVKSIDWWWRVSAAKNMKYPNLNDLFWAAGGNSELLAEESEQFEIANSFSETLGSWAVQLDLTYFNATINNYIQWVPTDLGYWRAENVRLVETQGFETGLNINRKYKEWSFSSQLNYTYTQSLNQTTEHEADESKGKQLIYIPEHQANWNARITYKSIYLNYNWEFVGARYLSSDNLSYLPYYQISNLSVGKELVVGDSNFELQASVLNLLNEEYQAVQWRPMPGRNYMLSLKWNLR